MAPPTISKTPTVAVAIASYNRCETTLRCLATLLAQNGLGESWTMDIHLLDDASPDGTAANVAKHFPSVTVISGTGSLFWGGGMEKNSIYRNFHSFDMIHKWFTNVESH
jgi:GT2 family glycosyltransferase